MRGLLSAPGRSQRAGDCNIFPAKCGSVCQAGCNAATLVPHGCTAHPRHEIPRWEGALDDAHENGFVCGRSFGATFLRLVRSSNSSFFSTTLIEVGRHTIGLDFHYRQGFIWFELHVPHFSFGCFLNGRQERGGRPGMMSRELMKASCCLASLLSARHDLGSNAGLTKQMARLGSFLGAVTLRVNRPIFSSHLDIRKFLSEALVLSAVDPAIALVCNVMKHAPYSKIFSSAKNPWIRRVEMTCAKKGKKRTQCVDWCLFIPFFLW